MNRREFIKAGLTLGALGAVSRLSPAFAGLDVPAELRTAGPAQAVIELWIWGGPCQLEAFDPKPDAGADINGGHGAIPTAADGLFISDYLPKLASQADKFSIIRSMTHPLRAHESATYLMQTGRLPGGGVTYPAIGALLAMLNAGKVRHGLPPYVALTTGKGRFSECGFLGDRYSPFATGGNPAAADFRVDGFTPPGGLTPEAQERRLRLAAQLDLLGEELEPSHPEFAAFDRAGTEAAAVMSGPAAAVFNLKLEPAEVRERYGMNRFGQSCLAARRLVEAGVPYVTINASGWDTHKRHFETLDRIAPEMDGAVAALLDDLHRRGLLDTTLVWWSGEFGRTPRIDRQEPWQGGRNHYSECFCAMVAGGGFAGGRVVGGSDAVAGRVISRPVTPGDLLGSLYERCGINPDRSFPRNPLGLTEPILPRGNPRHRLRELYL